MSLKAQIRRLQMFSKDQKQRHKEENARREGRGMQISCFKIFEKKALDFFVVSNPICTSSLTKLSNFYVIGSKNKKSTCVKKQKKGTSHSHASLKAESATSLHETR
jgi:hypothetical protein